MHVNFRAARRFIVCGGRNFSDMRFIERIFANIMDDSDTGEDWTFIHGNAPGADIMVGEFIKHYYPAATVITYPADWKQYGKAAGPIRNKQMLIEGRPEWVLALPGGVGTENMIQQAVRSYVPVMKFKYDKDGRTIIAEFVEPDKPLDDGEYNEIMEAEDLMEKLNG